MIALFIVVFFVIFFWAAYEQAGSSMNLFADKNTNLNIGSLQHSVELVPVGELRSIIIIFAPVFAWIWTALGKRRREPSTPLKMVLGLALLASGFLFMVIGGERADTGMLVEPVLARRSYTFHTWGELCLSARSACRT